ncbi:MAG: hypothetical protein Q9223_001091 [Gallowayella weberi]
MVEENLPLTTSTAHLRGPHDLQPEWRDLALDWIAAKALRTPGITASHLALATTLMFGPIDDLEIYQLILSMHHRPGIGRSRHYHYWKELPWPDEGSKEMEAANWVEQGEGTEVDVIKKTEGRKADEEGSLDDRDNKLLTAYDFIYSKAIDLAKYQLVNRASVSSLEKNHFDRRAELLLRPQPADWIDRLTLVEQMEDIGLFKEGAKLEESAIALFSPEERQQAWDYDEGGEKGAWGTH